MSRFKKIIESVKLFFREVVGRIAATIRKTPTLKG